VSDDVEPVNVSALNQYAYCHRRCALIYLESEFAENRHTAHGNAEHARVDQVAHASNREGARVEYALPIWSDRLGLIGKGDVVEFWPDGTIYPVEYKHGAKKQHDNDDLQLAAQALCLEEMFGRSIGRGAIFHAKSKRRREVLFTSQLRAATEQTIASIRQMLTSRTVPPPLNNDTRCRECSLVDLCQPMALGNLRMLRREDLFDPNR